MDSEGSSASASVPARRNRKHRRPLKELKDLSQLNGLLMSPVFVCLMVLVMISLGMSFWLVSVHPDNESASVEHQDQLEIVRTDVPPMTLTVPHLPIFAQIPDGDKLAEGVMNGKPTLPGIVHILNKFTLALHNANLELSNSKADVPAIWSPTLPWRKST